MTSLMDKFREKTNLTDKLSIQRATSLMDHLDLHVNPNLLGNSGIALTGGTVILSNTKGVIDEDNEKVYTANGQMWNQILFWIALSPGTYTYSADLMGPISNPTFYVQNSNGSTTFSAYGIALANDNTWHRCKQTFSIEAANTYRVFFINVNKQKNIKLEVGDLATPLTESGATQSASSATQPTQPAASPTGSSNNA